jgi:glucose-6-phosphate dehydrogenase assembly protein OpcA
VSRAALWNVIVVARGREALQARKQLVDEMTPALPARVIVLCVDDDGGHPGATAGGRIEATVESHLVADPAGGRLLYSEQITLVGPPGSEPHFGALVRGLGIPGIPTAIFWLEPALAGPALARELLPLADRVVLDSTACFRPQQLFDLNGLTTRAQPVPVADLGWLRLGGLRSLFAGLFDPPVGGGPLAAATRLEIRHLQGSEAPALLFAAWLGVRLGWRPLRVTPAEGGIRCEVGRTETSLEILSAQLTPADGPCGRSGILSVTLEAGHHRFSIHRTAVDETRLESTFAPPRVVKLDSDSDAELAVAALGPRGRDPLFARCLAFAHALWTVDAAGGPALRP